MSTQPYWFQDAHPPRFPKLESDLTTDVLILGAGITGLTAAYLLAHEGREVTVIDAGSVWCGETGHTTAHLTEMWDFGYGEVERLHGFQKARAAFQSQRSALEFIGRTVGSLGIDCGFERLDAFLFLHPQGDKRVLEEELAALQRVGWSETEMWARIPGLPFAEGPCLRMPRQAQFHPLKYLAGLTSEFTRLGGMVYANTRAESIATGKVETSEHFRIQARQILVATHSPVKNVLFFLKEAAYRTYAIAGAVPKGSVPSALYWDTDEPYHYVRLAPRDGSTELLIVGGEDHKTGQADDASLRFTRLEGWAKERFPMMSRVEWTWSGQVIEPYDALPYIGKSPYHDRIFIATGYSGNGMTCGTLAGRMLADLVSDRPNEWSELYEPTRKSVGAWKSFAEENIDMARRFVGGRFEADEVTAESLKPGEGAVIRDGMAHVAAYRGEEGELTRCSAVCPHLGCVVKWNSAEKSFDCPCHGSRFTGEGRVITGPAVRDLKPQTFIGINRAVTSP